MHSAGLRDAAVRRLYDRVRQRASNGLVRRQRQRVMGVSSFVVMLALLAKSSARTRPFRVA